jgi:glutamine synthetase
VFLAGFELEFYLSELSKPSEVTLHLLGAGISRTWSSAACMREPFALCIEACMLALEATGLVIEQGHAECSPTQFEISIGPLPVMQAVDSLVCAKEIIKEVAYMHGLMANFLPMPFEDREPTGLHLHLSVHQQSSDQRELDV